LPYHTKRSYLQSCHFMMIKDYGSYRIAKIAIISLQAFLVT
jgi:hypothetical protein